MCVIKKFVSGLILILVMVWMAAGNVYGEVVADLEGLLKPEAIYVDWGRLYVIDNFSVYIYSLDDYRLIKKFGRKGEGPREFNSFIRVNSHKDQLLVNSRMKVSIYSKDGQFIREIRPSSRSWEFKSLGGNFVGVSSLQENQKGYFTINLYDGQLKKQKELTRIAYPFQPGGRINPLTALKRPPFYIQGGLVYFEGGYSGVIQCFDTNGKRVKSLLPAIKPTECTPEKEKEFREFFANDHRFKGVWAQVQKRIAFSKYFPLFKHYQVDGGFIYVITYTQTAGPHDFECIILDPDGRQVRRTQVTIRTTSILEEDEFPYCIKDGKLYQVVENIDTDEIELHITVI